MLLFKMLLHGLFASCISCARCFWGQMTNLNPVQWSETFVGRCARFARTPWYLYVLPGIMKVKRTNTIDREYSKTTKNHQKLITKWIRKAPYLAQYTEIGKLIKRFRTATFTGLDQWELVWKLYGHLSSSCICVEGEETLTKMCWDNLSEIQCTKKVSERLTFNLLTHSSTRSSLFSSTVGIWS